MISPETLRRYAFFGGFTTSQRKAIAMISEEVKIPGQTTVVQEGQPATDLYLLAAGDVDLYFSVAEEQRPDARREFLVGHVNPEEIFGLSAILSPQAYAVTARASSPTTLIKIDAEALRNLGELDPNLAYKMVFEVARAAYEQLNQAHIQLAAAWA